MERKPHRGDPAPFDLTRQPVSFPAERDTRLQAMARGMRVPARPGLIPSSVVLAVNHPFSGEIRLGEVSVEFVRRSWVFAVDLGEITLTECR